MNGLILPRSLVAIDGSWDGTVRNGNVSPDLHSDLRIFKISKQISACSTQNSAQLLTIFRRNNCDCNQQL